MRMTYMILIANNTVKLSKRDKAGKQYLWILITTYYLLSKNWDIFATRRRILLIINMDYFRGGEVRRKTLEPITKARVDLVFMRAFTFCRFSTD